MKTLYSTEPSFDIDQEYIKMLVVIEEEKQLVSNGNNWRQYLACFRGTNLYVLYSNLDANADYA